MKGISNRVSGLFRKFSDDDMLIFNIIVYIIVIVILYLALRAEYLDVYCPTQQWQDGVCGEGMGMAYKGSKPEHGDTMQKSLERLRIGSNFDTQTVKWRRCYIVSVIITLCIFLLILQRLPNGIELALSLIIINLLICSIFNFYSFHHIQNATGYMKGNIDNIEALLRASP